MLMKWMHMINFIILQNLITLISRLRKQTLEYQEKYTLFSESLPVQEYIFVVTYKPIKVLVISLL